MDFLISLLAGVLQGLTEFLPVSSSGHLVLLHNLFDFQFSNDLLFDVLLHLATLLALVTFFFQDLKKIIKDFFTSFSSKTQKTNFNNEKKLPWLIIIGTIPATVIGYLAEDVLIYFRNPTVVAINLTLIGLYLILVENYAKQNKDIKSLNFPKSFMIGLAQACAIIPGVSRSGITIVSGMVYGLKRNEAARFSFLLSIPIVFGAGLKKATELSLLNLNITDVWFLVVGFLGAFVSGYLCIKYFLKFLNSHSLKLFAWYRFALALAILFWII